MWVLPEAGAAGALDPGEGMLLMNSGSAEVLALGYDDVSSGFGTAGAHDPASVMTSELAARIPAAARTMLKTSYRAHEGSRVF